MKTIKIFAAILCLVMLAACNKNAESAMRVRMTDAPGDFQQVNVEVISVQVHYSNEKNEDKAWVSLATNAGIYDLLTLQNDITAVLAPDTKIPAGGIDQMRLVLGAKNTVMIDSLVFDLKTPSAMQSGLKFNINAFLQADETYDVLIDFDAAKSIVIEGNGSFSLKPVIRVESVIQI